MKIVAAIRDLMFSSKVNAAAQGRPITWLPRTSGVAEFVALEKPDVLFVDLAAPQLGALDAIRAIKADPATRACTVIGYADHTREDLISAAEQAGCDRVMSKGEFARRLPELLAGL